MSISARGIVFQVALISGKEDKKGNRAKALDLEGREEGWVSNINILSASHVASTSPALCSIFHKLPPLRY